MSCSVKTTILAAMIAVSGIAASAAIIDVAHGVAYPHENSHASPQMQAAFPDLF